MVGTIVPIVYGAGGRRRYDVVVAHSVGLLVGAAALGMGLWSLSRGLALDLSGAAVLVPVLAIAYGLHHLGVLRLPIPSLRKQVPARWRGSSRPRLIALAYGLGLGIGVLTHVRTATFFFACLMAMLVDHPAAAAGVMSAYGLGRLAPLASYTVRAQTLGSAYRLNDDLLQRRAGVETLNALMLFATAGTSLMWLLR